ncbi:putative membrane protein [Shimia isoporae]|uniref:Putative membrane protein n=1 Tax=Shimia isoporae TaxID=647720 RepID=A0A4R1N0R9_9RHOB|nr:TIGR01620 family protein [Shimia isoporae]TCK99456.1 putative membrane protein [Shimia isoporae]
MTQGPVLIDIEEGAAPDVAKAAPVPEFGAPEPQGQAMQVAARLGSRKLSWLASLFWGLLATFVSAAVSVAAWDFAVGLAARSPTLGLAVSAVGLALLGVAAVMVLRELAGFARLRRVDGLKTIAARAVQSGDLAEARGLVDRLQRFYRGREDLRWGRDTLSKRREEVLDGDALLALTETELMGPLDKAAQMEVEAAARQVAAVTALVPLALADVIAALTANLRMIRRIAEIYGGRTGALGNWRLFRAVMTHLVATGAVAAGDDLIGSMVGGGALAKLSRRFGEGIVNGALTARVGVAAMEVCRPMPFGTGLRPSVTGLVKRALAGLFSKESRDT